MKISETSIALLNNVNRVLQGVKRGKKTIINYKCITVNKKSNIFFDSSLNRCLKTVSVAICNDSLPASLTLTVLHSSAISRGKINYPCS